MVVISFLICLLEEIFKDMGMDNRCTYHATFSWTDGVRKMSKSYDNYISFNDSAKDMFGKSMSLSDAMGVLQTALEFSGKQD